MNSSASWHLVQGRDCRWAGWCDRPNNGGTIGRAGPVFLASLCLFARMMPLGEEDGAPSDRKSDNWRIASRGEEVAPK